MIEEIVNMLETLFSLDNLLVLMFLVDAFAVIGIFANAFTGRSNGTPSRRRVRQKKPKPRRIDATKVYYNQEEPTIKMEGENGLSHVKEAVGAKLKPNGTLEKFPVPLKDVPAHFPTLVHNAKNNIEKPKIKPNDEELLIEPLTPNAIREVDEDV